jgi:hypothetical protein
MKVKGPCELESSPREVQVYKGTIRREIRRRVRTETGSWTDVADGYEEVTYTAELSVSGVRSMAGQAAKNKSGKSKDGALTVFVTSRRRI